MIKLFPTLIIVPLVFDSLRYILLPSTIKIDTNGSCYLPCLNLPCFLKSIYLHILKFFDNFILTPSHCQMREMFGTD